MRSWRTDLANEIAKLPGDAVAYFRERGEAEPSAWVAADTSILEGLEAWARELATRDPMLGLAALAVAAHGGFATAMETAGGEEEEMGFHASEGPGDGAPVETQIANALAFLDEPSHATLKTVREGFDPTRQLYAWGDDLMPGTEIQPWFWYLEVGQCLACAIIKGDATSPTADLDSMDDGIEVEAPSLEEFDAEDRDSGYEHWPAAVCVARGLVMTCRALRQPEDDDDAPGLATLRAAMAAPPTQRS